MTDKQSMANPLPFYQPEKLSDWPKEYAERVRENECYDEPDEVLLDILSEHHQAMRFGQYIDLNIQQGFYLRLGNGQITKPQGSDSGYVIGALDHPSITITNNGLLDWWSSDAERHYVADDGVEKLAWAFDKATGPWMLVCEYAHRKGEEWDWLVLRFLSDDDEAAFRKAFPKA